MAKELAIIVMAVSHVNRQSARGGIDIHSGLGGGAVEQNSDVVMTISGDRSNPMREVKTVKARDQDPFTLRFNFDYKKSFRFKPIAIGSATAPVKGLRSGGGSLTKPKRLSTAN
jgi:hypothetical protein